MKNSKENPERAPLNDEALIDFANNALEVEDRITMARVLSEMPIEAAQTFGFMADRDELLLALGLLNKPDGYPKAPAPLPEIGGAEPKGRNRLPFGSPLMALLLVLGISVFAFQGSRNTSDSLMSDALQANSLAHMRLNMKSMDEDTAVDPYEIQRLAGITLPQHPATWVVRDTQVIPSGVGVSLLRTYEIGADGVVTLYIARGDNTAPQTPSRLDLKEGQAAWFRHEGAEYVLIGRQARAPLDDEAALLLASFIPA
ncbi:MAG: hypothetical protein ACSHWZ_17595 [Sulfitobacter sp.]